ncbi:hypothetical protein HIM_01185 [Hirsutella minnesotensis 3608]|nr:hypothetical protein HIM_01185 [Hirsutella minnesotensis 3608]
MGQSIGSLFPLRFRLWLGRLLFGPLESDKAVRVSWHRLIKGPCYPPEVEAMQYVAAHTTIPIPKIYAIHTQDNGCIYIEMAWIRGNSLDGAWSGLSKDQKDAIVTDLKQHVSSLRELPPPTPGMASSAFQNPGFDCRLGYGFWGPVNLEDFHSLARGHLIMEDVAPFLGEEVAKVHTGCYQMRFTHADLAPRNIIVRDGRVAAIIDWAYAGWYPEYWEFTKAHYSCFRDEQWKDEYLHHILPCYDTELAAERVLWRKLPEPATRTYVYRDGVGHQLPGSRPSAAWFNARAGHQLKDLWSLVRF